MKGNTGKCHDKFKGSMWNPNKGFYKWLWKAVGC